MQKSIAKQAPPGGIDPVLKALLAGRLHNPFSYLGLHSQENSSLVRVFYPYANNVEISIAGKFEPMVRTHPSGIFEWRGATNPPLPYLLRIEDGFDTSQLGLREA